MNTEIERLNNAIALAMFDIRPEDPWIDGTYHVDCISSFMNANCVFRLQDGTKNYGKASFESDMLFFELRKEMAKINNKGHAWYTASCVLTDVGKFKFDFDYDHLPAFDIIPDPERWILEFKEFPRPDLQLHVQDWIDEKAEPSVIVERLKRLHSVAKP